VPANLGHGLVANFAFEGVEPVRQMILKGNYDTFMTDLREGLVAACKLMGAPGIKFVVSYGYSVACATEAVLLPLKAVCRADAGCANHLGYFGRKTSIGPKRSAHGTVSVHYLPMQEATSPVRGVCRMREF
jgi:hypothetical protein